jgi:hypothetical protein
VGAAFAAGFVRSFVDFEVHPVVNSSEAAEKIGPRR